MSSRPFFLPALLVSLVVGLGALTPAPANAARPRSTVITVSAPDCVGCSVQLIRAERGQVRAWHSRTKAVAGDGLVAFRVQTTRTHGMSIQMTAPWEGDVDARTGVVMRYDAIAAGAVVPPSVALAQTRGSGCWSGTHKRQITLRLGVAAVTVPAAHSDGTAQMLVAWMSPQVRSQRHQMALTNGGIGLQDYLVC